MRLVALIYENTVSANNPMRRLLVDAWYDHASEESFGDYELAAKEFLWDLALKSMSWSKNSSLPIQYTMDEFMEEAEDKTEET
jgi:hypothetical protein